jgi:hypothetical protein
MAVAFAAAPEFDLILRVPLPPEGHMLTLWTNVAKQGSISGTAQSLAVKSSEKIDFRERRVTDSFPSHTRKPLDGMDKKPDLAGCGSPPDMQSSCVKCVCRRSQSLCKLSLLTCNVWMDLCRPGVALFFLLTQIVLLVLP